MEEHEGVFVIVCMEEGSGDVIGGHVTALVSINGGSHHNAVSSNSGGGTIFLFVTGFPALLAAISARVGADASVPFLDNVHEGFQCHFAFGGAEGVGFNRVVYLVVIELGELGNGSRLAGLTKFLDAHLNATCLCKCNGSSLRVGVMDESGPEDVHEWVKVDRQGVVGIVARVGGDVNSSVLVVAVQVGFVVQASLGEASWGWDLGGSALSIN